MPGVRLFDWRWARRASFSRCFCCRARSRSRLPVVVFPGPAMMSSFRYGRDPRPTMDGPRAFEWMPLPWELIYGARFLSGRERVSQDSGHGSRLR